jgi:hypothetical protein
MRLALALAAFLLPLLAGTSCQSLPGESGETPLWDRPGWTPHPTHPGSLRAR